MKRKGAVAIDRDPHGRQSEAPVALVDMDGTLCDCSGAIARELAKIRGPHEDPREEESPDPPAHIAARRCLIMSLPGFWRNLQPLPLGFHIVELLSELGFETRVLTKGPKGHSLGWMEKFDWCRQYVPQMPVIMTEDKGLVHGAVFVEDWPPYIARWFRACPRGLVIAPAQPWNLDIEATFPARSIRYDGTNLEFVRERLETIRVTAGRNRRLKGGRS
jgi:5'-nucleotidase